MKNLIFKSSFNEKLKMLLVLIGVLMMSVSQGWGYELNYPTLYFDNQSSTTWSKAMFFYFIDYNGSGRGSMGVNMQKITNTNLYYVQECNNRGNDMSGFAYGFIDTQNWGWEGGDNWNSRWTYACNNFNHSGSSQTNLPYGSYLCTSTGGSNLSVTKLNDGDDGSGNLKYDQKVKVVVNGTTPSTSPAAITIASGYWTSKNSVSTSSSNNITKGGSTIEDTYGNAAYTATTTLTAGTPTSGYYFVGWYTAATGGSLISTNNPYTYYPRQANTIYARFEKRYSVTVSAGSNGSTSPSSGSTVTAGYYTTSGNISATANDGYYFTDWSLVTGISAASGYSSTSNPIQINATAASKKITANFAGRYVLRGSTQSSDTDLGGLPGWSVNVCNMTTIANQSTKTVTLRPNTNYKYKIRDLAQDPGVHGQTGSNTQGFGSGNAWTLDGDKDVKITTQAYGTYTFYITQGTNPSVYITAPANPRIIYSGVKTWTEGTGTVGTGGTNTVTTTENDPVTGNPTAYTIANGKYIRNNGTAVFTAAANAGYQFMGWFNSSTYNPATQEPISVENPYTISNITSNKTIYALFKEIVFDVTVKLDGTTPTTLKVGKVSHPSITATVPSGKVFDRWVTTGSAAVADATSKTTTITSVSDNQSTVTATFKDLPKIYVDLNAATGWSPSKMYVVFYKNGGYFDTNKGTGLSSTYVITSTPCEMKKISGTKIWYYEYDPNSGVFSGQTITCVAFIDHTFSANYGNFTSCTAIYRTDFDACMNMFVVTDNTGTNKNSSCYYRNTNAISDDASKGYWRNYEEKNSGFYLNNLNGGSFEFTNEDGGNTYSTSVNLEKNKTYYFYIGGCGGQNWSNNQGSYPFNTNNRTRNVIKYNDVSSDGNRCKLTTTEAGYYTFKLTPSNTAAQMSVTIDFPINSGDYRATVTHSGKEFPSNTIKSGTSSGTISLYLKQGSNTLSIQKYNGTKWVQQTTQMVSPSKNGVYTMTLTCNNTSSTVSTPVPYEGEFYIRTDCAPGGWRDYTENKMTYNELTFSESDATTFDYYFCKWISSSGYNVRFVVGNEINMAISDTLIHDAALGSGTEEVLPAPANVRFSYNSYTNEVKRAYISGATNPNDRFLIMHTNNKVFTSTGAAINYHSTYSNLNANEAYFYDRNNWVYYVELQAQSGSTAYLTAHYNGADRDLYGSSSSPKPVLTSNTDTKYNILVTYDFKTNNLLTAWHPGANVTVNDDISSIPSVMFIRKHQEQADQVTIGTGSVAPSTIYGVMKFNKYILNNQSESGEHASTSLSATERDLYWISFPFDVNLSDVFGFGEYGKHWIIEEYDGAERASKGYWIDSPGFWKFVTDRSGKVLEKGKGYVLALDLDELRISSDIWNNNVTDVYLYFPSKEKLSIENVKASDITEVPAHTCTINRQKPGDTYDINKNRTIADSHWNLIGVPLFANSTGFTFSANYYYAWNYATNTYSTESATTSTLKTMQAYMVQFAGTLDWYNHTTTNAIVGRRAMADNLHFAEFKLDLMQGEESLDHAFVRLSDEDEVTTNFEFGYDLCKEFNGGKANIYTIAENYIPVAGNCLPISLDQTTSVPMGVRIVSDGEYIFSMPEGTKGVGVTLIDNETGTRTNLGLTDYSVTLTTGDHNNRFVLEISPIEHTTTAIENSEKTDAPNNVCKKLIDGVLYIIKDGKVFDARGARLQ